MGTGVSRSREEKQPSRSKEGNNDLSALLREDNKRVREALNMVQTLVDIIQDERQDLRTKNAYINEAHDTLQKKIELFKKKGYIDKDILDQIDRKLYDVINKAGDLSIKSGTPGLDVSGELTQLRGLALRVRSEINDVGLLLDYYQERQITEHEDISVLTLLDEPRLSIFLPKIARRQLRQKGASAKCEENLNLAKIFKESKLNLVSLEDDDYTLQSNVFQIKQFRLSIDSLCKVDTFSCDKSSSEEWAAIMQIDGKWIEVPVTLKNNCVQFYTKGMETVYIISRPRCTRFTLTNKGWTFQAEEEQNVHVEFPVDAVKRETPITLKVLTEQVGYRKGNEEVDEFEVYDVSPCVMVDHRGLDKFMNPVKVSLPLPETTVHSNTFVVLLHWTHDDEIELQEQNIEIRSGVGIAEVDSFTGRLFARVRRGDVRNYPSRKNHIKRQISNRLGRMTDCQILIFVDTAEVNTLWVEVVSSDNVNDLLTKRRKDNPRLFEMHNSRSGEISLADMQGIEIYVEGKLRVVPGYTNGYTILTFRKNSMENHVRFPLEPNPNGFKDKFTYMNFKTQKGRNTAKMADLHRYHFSEIESYRVQEFVAPKDVINQRRNRTQIKPSEVKQLQKPGVPDGDFFSERSFRVLAENIPIRDVESLGIQLAIKANDIENFKAQGHTGFNLTFRILQQWMKLNGTKSIWERITNLSNSLGELKLLNVASIVNKVFKEKREMQRADFSS